jgi:hypothetical protein
MFVVPSKICLPKNNSFFPQNLWKKEKKMNL